MARKATKKQKEDAKKLGIRVTKSVKGKRVPKTSEELKKQIKRAKDKKSTRQIGSTKDRTLDKKYKAKKAGERTSRKYAIVEYTTKDPKTGKKVTKKYKRRNANQYGLAEGGKRYTERRASKSDKGKTI